MSSAKPCPDVRRENVEKTDLRIAASLGPLYCPEARGGRAVTTSENHRIPMSSNSSEISLTVFPQPLHAPRCSEQMHGPCNILQVLGSAKCPRVYSGTNAGNAQRRLAVSSLGFSDHNLGSVHGLRRRAMGPLSPVRLLRGLDSAPFCFLSFSSSLSLPFRRVKSIALFSSGPLSCSQITNLDCRFVDVATGFGL